MTCFQLLPCVLVHVLQRNTFWSIAMLFVIKEAAMLCHKLPVSNGVGGQVSSRDS
jgi:hypothetical protein